MASASMTSDSNYWYFTINPDYNSSCYYTLKTYNKFMDKHVQIKVYCPNASIGSGSVYKQITKAGWVGKFSGSNSGKSYSIYKLPIISSQSSSMCMNFLNGGDYAYFTYNCKNKVATSNITISIGDTAKNTRFNDPRGYVFFLGSVCYMCYATNDSSGPSAACIDGLVRDGNTWTVGKDLSDNNCYVYARAGSTNYDFAPGDNFRYTRTDGSTWHSGYYTRTPGGSTWHSGYTSYWTRWDVYKNDQNIYSNYSYEPHFYGYAANSYSGTVVYVYR